MHRATHPIRMRPLENYGDHMPVTEFVDYVEVGLFIDYDGHGELATAEEVSDLTIFPSQVRGRGMAAIPREFTHIVWYNR